LLAERGIPVRLTRENDSYLPLEQRCEMANNLKAGLFLSVHGNASPDRTAHGLEVFHHPASEPGKRLAEAIHGELGKLGRANRGVTPADFYVLKHTAMPAGLVECGFLTNPDESLWLKGHVRELAAALAQGIANVLAGAKGQ
jgi:N-acetylmuramoyl-L-alanine amidase